MKLPINLLNWINDNKDSLKPPVGNKVLLEDKEFLVMAVGGPNARNDYHYNEGEEFFFQLKGDITLKLQVNGAVQVVQLKEGEVFLLPSKVPHSPIRPADTIGLVVERKRSSQENDGLLWFCEKCNHLLFEKHFSLESIEKDFIPVFREFNLSLEHRTCKACGHVMPADSRYV